MSNSIIKRHSIFFIILIVSVCVLSQLNPQQYKEEHGFLIGSYIVSFLMYWILSSNKQFDFFHPIHLYFIFYFFIFFITPLWLIDEKKTYCVDDYVMGACIKATIIVVLALLSFSIGYSCIKLKITRPMIVENIENVDMQKKILKFSLQLFIVFYIISIFYLFSTGKSLLSILTLGSMNVGSTLNLSGNDSMQFLINVSYLLLVPWLFIIGYSKSRLLKIILSYLMVGIFLCYGFRFIIYIMIFGFCIVHTRIHNYKIKFYQIAILMTMILLFSVLVGSTRQNMRGGQNVYFEGFNEENIAETLESNFNIYKTYYGVVGGIPEKHDYFYGQALFVYPFVMWIPRTIWHDKPYATEFPAGVALNICCPSALKQAMSFPNIYEYYIDFGLLGVCFFSFLIGIISKKMIRLYNSNSVFDVICYALYIGFLIQFINRGYIAQLITLFVFLYSPMLLYRKYFPKKTN